MAAHSENAVDKLVKKLQERHEYLVSTMRGRPVKADEIHMNNYPETHRVVDPSEIRIAVDDFATILKEIKLTLGKKK
jgi:hypothetical protein